MSKMYEDVDTHAFVSLTGDFDRQAGRFENVGV
jgi:hypothetical protein